MKTYRPTKEMRTNPLSLQEGGSIVTVIYDNYVVEFTNIKNPITYISSIRCAKQGDNTLKGFLINGEEYDMGKSKINKNK
jgi:hypothetical protein